MNFADMPDDVIRQSIENMTMNLNAAMLTMERRGYSTHVRVVHTKLNDFEVDCIEISIVKG